MSVKFNYGGVAGYQPPGQGVPVAQGAAPQVTALGQGAMGPDDILQRQLEQARQNQARMTAAATAARPAQEAMLAQANVGAAHRAQDQANALAGEKDLAVNYIHKTDRWGSGMRDENMRASYDKKLQALADAKGMSMDEVEGYLREIFPQADRDRFRTLTQDGIGQPMEVRSDPAALAAALEAGNTPGTGQAGGVIDAISQIVGGGGQQQGGQQSGGQAGGQQQGGQSGSQQPQTPYQPPAYQPGFQPPPYVASQIDPSLTAPQAQANKPIIDLDQFGADLQTRLNNQRQEYAALMAMFGPQAQQAQGFQQANNDYLRNLLASLSGGG